MPRAGAGSVKRGFGVREKLVGLVLVALLPCVALQVLRIADSFHNAVRRELDGDRAYAQAVGTAFVDYLNDLWAREAAAGAAITEGPTAAPDRMRMLLDAELPSAPGLRALSWVNPDGVVAASTRAGAAGASVAGRGYFQRLRGGATAVVSALAPSPVAGMRAVSVARAVRRGGRLVGVVVGSVDPRGLRAVLPSAGADNRVFGLVDRRLSVVYRSDVGGAPAAGQLLDRPAVPAVRALQGKVTLSSRFTARRDGVPSMGAAVPVRPIGWAAFTAVPIAQALAAARRAATQDFILLAAIALASWLAALALARRMLRPVMAMHEAAAAISAGDLSARVGLSGEDEPAATAAAFDRMADRVERLLDWQASAAGLGQRALSGARVHDLLEEALAIVRRHLKAEIALVQEYNPERQEIAVRAASGWDGRMPPVRSSARPSWARYALEVDQPVVVEDMATEERFVRSRYLAAQGVVSGVCVVIHSPRRPYGVLGAYCVTRRSITPEDTSFMQTVANVLGAAIARRRIEQRLRQANARLSTLVNASPVPIVAVDNDGCVTVWNPAAGRVFGWPEAEVLGRPLPTLLTGDDDGLREFWRRLGATEVYTGVVERRRRDGTRLDVEVASACLYDEQGRPSGRIAVLVDVTERTRFLQIAAHELRNPVAGAKGIVALLRRRLAADRPLGDLAQTLAVLEHEVDRFSTMLGQMLDAFRLHQGILAVRRERIDLAAVVRAAVASFRAAHEDFRFDLEGAGVPVWIRGDAPRLEEVFCNLLSNAVKYSGEARAVRVALSAGTAAVRVSVSDAGVGIPAQETDRVFEQFFRASNVRAGDPGGLGLGLFVCSEVVGRHDGRIWVESEPGSGTTFHVEFPAGADGARG